MKNSKTVILVDDEAINRKVIGRMLEHLGFTVLPAVDAFEALSILNEMIETFKSCYAILSDYNMPGKNGVELLTEVGILSSETRRYLMSTFMPPPEEITPAEPQGCLVKPFTMTKLRTAFDIEQ